jgi:integrase
MTKPSLRLVTPTTENRTVTPSRPKNGTLRTREHLTTDEVERLIETTKNNRYGHRDALMVLLAFRHGLRAGEVCDLRWEQVDFKTASLHVRRLKNGTPSTHPLTGRELRALRRHLRESEKSPFVFVSEREVRRFPRPASPGWSNGQQLALNWKSKRTLTCFAMPVVTSSLTTATIPGHCKPTWDTEISRTPRGILRWRKIGSRVSGKTSAGST